MKPKHLLTPIKLSIILQPRGQRKNMCDKKGRALQNEVKKGQVLKNEGIKLIN